MEAHQRKLETARYILGVIILTAVPLAFSQVQVGDNTQLQAGGLVTFGYAGDYGTDIPSEHGLNFGVNGKLNGYYYNPNFISFTASPYYNQSRVDSDYQSLTGASGISGTANFFTGSHFPGSVGYRYDENSTGTFGFAGQPNFTTHGSGDGFSIGWSALIPDLPTLSIGYSQGSGGGDIYGTDESTHSDQRLINLRSTYTFDGFHLNGFYDHDTFNAQFPEFLAGEQSVEDTSAHDYGFGATHILPLHGSFYANVSRSSASTDVSDGAAENTSYTDTSENAGATFHPTQKVGLFATESYTGNLSGFLSQNITNSEVIPIDLGSGSHSLSIGGGASYQFTQFLFGQAQATHYDQYYFGKDYTDTYISGTVGYSKKLFDMFSFSGSVIESATGQGQSALGYIGNVNYSHRIAGWLTSGHFSYAQNVQTLLITYTSSYYNEGLAIEKRFPGHFQWAASYNGSHSGIANQSNSSSHSDSFSTSFGNRRFTLQGNYSKSNGLSFLTGSGLQLLPPTPGLTNSILFAGTSYGGGLSGTPLKRLVLSATFTRALSDTTGGLTFSRNDTEVFTSQLQYHLRRISVLGGYTRFVQSVSASGLPPVNSNAYFIGISRWFDFF